MDSSPLFQINEESESSTPTSSPPRSGSRKKSLGEETLDEQLAVVHVGIQHVKFEQGAGAHTLEQCKQLEAAVKA